MLATKSLMDNARQALRENLVVRRATHRLSQAELAKKAGVSRPIVIKLEQGSGNVTLDSLARIASALGCTVVELLEPWQPIEETDEELESRAKAPPEDFTEARELLAAIDEARAVKIRRPAARRRKVARRSPSRRS